MSFPQHNSLKKIRKEKMCHCTRFKFLGLNPAQYRTLLAIKAIETVNRNPLPYGVNAPWCRVFMSK